MELRKASEEMEFRSFGDTSLTAFA